MQDRPNVVISTWVPRQIAHIIQAIADEERRSRSSVVRNVLLDTLAAQVISERLSDEAEEEKEQ